MALDSSPDFVLMTLRVLRVSCSVECPSVGICLAFFSWVSYLEEEDHRDKVPFSRQGWMLIRTPCHCWRCPWCPPQALLVRVLCWAATLLPLPTLHPLERSHPARPTHKGVGGYAAPPRGRRLCISYLKLFCMDLTGPHFLCNCGLWDTYFVL